MPKPLDNTFRKRAKKKSKLRTRTPTKKQVVNAREKYFHGRDGAVELQERHKRFCEEYILDMSGREAARRAGFVATNPALDVRACKLLKDYKVRLYIDYLMRERIKRTDVEADEVIEKLVALAFSDPREMFNENGSFKDMKDLTPAAAQAISSIEVTELFDGEGRCRRIVGHLKKIKFWNKVQAMELLCRHLGILKDKLVVDYNEKLTLRLEVENLKKLDKEELIGLKDLLQRAGHNSVGRLGGNGSSGEVSG